MVLGVWIIHIDGKYESENVHIDVHDGVESVVLLRQRQEYDELLSGRTSRLAFGAVNTTDMRIACLCTFSVVMKVKEDRREWCNVAAWEYHNTCSKCGSQERKNSQQHYLLIQDTMR